MKDGRLERERERERCGLVEMASVKKDDRPERENLHVLSQHVLGFKKKKKEHKK
jgi:hypothetical protein